MTVDPLAILFSGAQEAIGRDGVGRKLSKGKTLTVKLGVDPTRPDLTLGHMVVFRKMRQFQDMGHRTVFLIGDFTTTIGDPSGRSETRPVLTAEQIENNSKTYLEQAFKILDPDKTEVRRNGEWFSKMSFADALLLTREMTVAQLLEREDFAKRHGAGTPISLVEFLYPLLQGYDSLMLGADVELGGSDQLFNMLVGRTLQKSRGESGQAVLCMPLLIGLDGVRKMSKSYDNYIAFNDSATDMFGKIMSLPDGAMESYCRLLLGHDEEEIAALQALHPMEAKKRLAAAIVEIFHGAAAAAAERQRFENVFSDRGLPEEMDAITLESTPTDPVELLFASGKFPSKKEIRRLWEQGALRIGGRRLESGQKIEEKDRGSVLQVGRRQFFQLS
ncbi:MAG: tyrosine--tRNA ligase [Puniceicoccales bacterium]|jgi:tyrosyl-tRNA synthetase|nr:tyrosine--tRNA ligase [Puniceicoccales bacterium]